MPRARAGLDQHLVAVGDIFARPPPASGRRGTRAILISFGTPISMASLPES